MRSGRRMADTLLEPSAARNRLTKGVYVARSEHNLVGILELALEAVVASDAAERKIRRAYGRGVHTGNCEEYLNRGVAESVIGETEAVAVRKAMSLTKKVLAVDRRTGSVPSSASPGGAESAIRVCCGKCARTKRV